VFERVAPFLRKFYRLLAMKNFFNFGRSGVFTKSLIFSLLLMNSEMLVNSTYSVTEVTSQVVAKREQIFRMAETGSYHRLASRNGLFVNAGLTNYWRSHPKFGAESRAQQEWRERRAARRLFAKVVAFALMLFIIWICFKIIGIFLSLFD